MKLFYRGKKAQYNENRVHINILSQIEILIEH